MSLLPKKDFWDRLMWSWRPQTDREAGEAVVANFLLHWFPNRVTLKSLAAMSEPLDSESFAPLGPDPGTSEYLLVDDSCLASED